MEASRTTPSILEKGDFFSLAKEELEKALELDPIHPLALLVKGTFLIIRAEKNGTNPMDGISLLEKASVAPHLSDNRKAKAYFGLSLGYFLTKRIPEALKACKSALNLDKDLFPAQRLLEELHMKKAK